MSDRKQVVGLVPLSLFCCSDGRRVFHLRLHRLNSLGGRGFSFSPRSYPPRAFSENKLGLFGSVCYNQGELGVEFQADCILSLRKSETRLWCVGTFSSPLWAKKNQVKKKSRLLSLPTLAGWSSGDGLPEEAKPASVNSPTKSPSARLFRQGNLTNPGNVTPRPGACMTRKRSHFALIGKTLKVQHNFQSASNQRLGQDKPAKKPHAGQRGAVWSFGV